MPISWVHALSWKTIEVTEDEALMFFWILGGAAGRSCLDFPRLYCAPSQPSYVVRVDNAERGRSTRRGQWRSRRREQNGKEQRRCPETLVCWVLWGSPPFWVWPCLRAFPSRLAPRFLFSFSVNRLPLAPPPFVVVLICCRYCCYSYGVRRNSSRSSTFHIPSRLRVSLHESHEGVSIFSLFGTPPPDECRQY